MKKIVFLVTISILIFVQSCGSGNGDSSSSPKSSEHPDARFVSTQTFSFTATVDPSTLFESDIILISSRLGVLGDTFTISTPEELAAFNQTLHPPITFSDLDIYTYFLLRGPSCPHYYEYSSNQYKPPIIAIVMNEFILDNVACKPLGVGDGIFYVLKGRK